MCRTGRTTSNGRLGQRAASVLRASLVVLLSEGLKEGLHGVVLGLGLLVGICFGDLDLNVSPVRISRSGIRHEFRHATYIFFECLFNGLFELIQIAFHPLLDNFFSELIDSFWWPYIQSALYGHRMTGLDYRCYKWFA